MEAVNGLQALEHESCNDFEHKLRGFQCLIAKVQILHQPSLKKKEEGTDVSPLNGASKI